MSQQSTGLTKDEKPTKAGRQGKRAQHGRPQGVVSDDQPDAHEGQAGRFGETERFAVPRKPGNAGGGKGPQQARARAPPVHRYRAAAHPRTPPTPLLVSRKDAAIMLGGISIATLQRMEERGTLERVRLNPDSKIGQVFYRFDDLVRLAQGDDQDA